MTSLLPVPVRLQADLHGLCDFCIDIDFTTLFSDRKFTSPTKMTSGLLLFHRNTELCYLYSHLQDCVACPFCTFIAQIVGKNPAANAGLTAIDVERGELSDFKGYRETDTVLSGLKFLFLNGWTWAPNRRTPGFELCVGIIGSHQLFVPVSIEDLIDSIYGMYKETMNPTTPPDETIQTIGNARIMDTYIKGEKRYTIEIQRLGPRVDLNRVRSWIANCEVNHHGWCAKAVQPPMPPVDFRLIDVSTGTIVEMNTDCRYVALSYRWGQVKHLQLTEATKEELMTPGGLASKITSLPKTIQDAIYLCQQIQERYLWIDTICIMQDSDVDKNEQIKKMDSIYGKAFLTIAAAGGSDASASLPGLRKDFQDRQPTLNIAGLGLVSLHTGVEKLTSRSEWNTRGWVFQEQVLSTRILYFTSDLVYFECLESLRREDFNIFGPNAEKFRLTPDSNDNSGFQAYKTRCNFRQQICDPNLDFSKIKDNLRKHAPMMRAMFTTFSMLVKDYTRRDLTQHSDIHNAFLGVEKFLCRHMGPFFQGIPEAAITSGLAWHSLYAQPKRVPQYPSWSWLGWKFGGGNCACYPGTTWNCAPKFFRVENTSMLVSVFEGQADIPWRNKEEKNTIEEHGNLWRMPAQYEAEQMQAAGDMIKVLHSQCGRSPDQVPPLEHLLIFTASIVPAAQVAAGELKVLFTRSREDGAVETHATLEVTSELLFLLLVEWKAGVAYRVCPDMLFYVDQCKWEEVTKAWKLIILA
ncbi:hypothetical protein ACJQWK_04794 [Exserohilum turcicum]|uniref:Heterokaryon incompatibility domain-containing protein n=1 Tax=Exserohilum turcicum (strain 28A) TaxID=671987 RepID=R0K2P3_EXST2|nr:uncharacterized protein SETTUDRAFT_22607 [Exserohilum turcica Et28A]EOA82627.1 hypothetical protein SETTUDRAFT_22607 [Exserohilum turcica Et28A]